MRTLRTLIPALILALVPASVALAQNITSTSVPNGILNQSYSAQLTCTNCTGDPWSVASGSLPNGLSLNSSSGLISGTPTAIGMFNFQVEIAFPGGFVQQNLSIAITAQTLTVLTTSLPNGTLGAAYPAQMLSATGGVSPYTWSVSEGFPPGLTLDSVNGIVSGTPTETGSFSFTLTVFDTQQKSASVNLTITVSTTGQTAITTTTLPNGVISQPYSQRLTCVNCATYTWSISSGGLPQGLTMDGSGLISGTPVTLGTSSFVVALSSNLQSERTTVVFQSLSITIVAGALTINETSLPPAFQNTPYKAPLTASGGTPPYTWSLTSTANDGLTIGSTSGIVNGTPTATGLVGITVLVTDSTGSTGTRSYALTVATGLSVLTKTLPNAVLNAVYPTQTLQAGGGQPPYRWTILTTGPGNLPPGLALDPVFGRISGTPTTSGVFPFTLVVTDNTGGTANGTVSITVGGTITIAPATLPPAAVGAAYSQTLTASGGTAPYTWSITAGSLPVGLTLSPVGAITGTPTLPGNASFTIQATDATGASGTAALSIVVNGAVTITTTSLPDATVGLAYSQTLAATGGTAPYTWSITTGALPAGLTLNATSGLISGTPTAAAASSFTVTVTDAAKGTAQQALSIATATALTVTPTSLPAAVVGVAYTQKFTATGGKAPYTFALTGTLPTGFTFTASTATISGTAPAAESGTVTLTVTDASARTVSESLILAAAATPLSVTPTTLPAAVVGVAYTQKLTASGGTAPYTFAVTLGALPAGFTFTASTATISGTAAAAESGNFTITVTDSAGATLNVPLALTANNPPAPTVTVTLSGPSTSGFDQQIPVTLATGASYPVDITGSVVLTFAPSVTPATGVDDAMIQFSSGSRVINFTIPAGTTAPKLTNASSITVLTGTTAGTITLTTNLTANGVALTGPKPTTIVNASGVPFISSVSFQQTAGGVTVTVVGFSSTRDMVSGLFHFAPASGISFASSDITVQLASAFSTWYSNTAQSNPYGTQFTLTAPFSLSTQSTSVVSVTVTLTNSKGASNPVTLSQ